MQTVRVVPDTSSIPTTENHKSQAGNKPEGGHEEKKRVTEISKPKSKAPLLTVPTRKHKLDKSKKEEVKTSHNIKVKGWDDESLIYDDIGNKKALNKNHKKAIPLPKKKHSKIKDSSLSSLDILKTMQTMSKLAGYDQKNSGSVVMDLMGSLVKGSGQKKGGRKSDSVIDPLLDTAIEWMGGGKNNGIKNFVKPFIQNMLSK